jgi:hypothetical protein
VILPALTQYSVIANAHTTPPSARGALVRRVAAFLTASMLAGGDPEREFAKGVDSPEGGSEIDGMMVVEPLDGVSASADALPLPFREAFFLG